MTDEAKALVRPIMGIEYRTPQEVFDIMCDRFAYQKALIETQAREIERLREALGDLIEAVQRRTADLGGYDGRFGLNKSIVKARAALAGDSHDQ